MKKFVITLLALFMVTCFVQSGSASILYTATNNGAGSYTLNFKVTNDWGMGNVDWFSIYFGNNADPDWWTFDNADGFTNLVAGPNPATWWIDTLEYNPVFGDPAQYNAETDFDGDGSPDFSLAAGATQTGFSVTFDMESPASIGPFYYEFGSLDAYDYAWLGYGFTERDNQEPPAVPEPATILLFGLGLLGTAGISRKRN